MNDDKDQIFSNFIAQAHISIIDKGEISKNRLKESLLKLGAVENNIMLFDDFDQARKRGLNEYPQIVLSEYYVGEEAGIDFFIECRQDVPPDQDAVYILVTSNTSQVAVARAVEEDVDAFVIKPYSKKVFDEIIKLSILDKISPSPYVLKIEEGKKLLYEKKYFEASSTFKEAFDLHETPALAHYYHAQANLLLERNEEALKNYLSGLEMNNIHYKCLIGLYELFMQENRYHEAYEVLKKLAIYFPQNESRLTVLIRLAIITENYEDMEAYHQTFLSQEQIAENTVQYVCAGMYVCGQYFVQNNPEKTFQLYDKIGTIFGGRYQFIRGIIEVLTDHNHPDRAQNFLDNFPPEEQNSEHFKVSQFLVDSFRLAPEEVISKGADFITQDVHNFYVYKVMINAHLQKKQIDKAKELVNSGVAKWPDKKKSFDKIIASPES